MERLYTFTELNEMKRATLRAGAKMIISKATPKKEYTARELSAMTDGLLSSACIAGRGINKWYVEGKVFEYAATRYIGGGRKLLAELDTEGNIVKTFYATLPGRNVNVYRIR